MRQTPLFWTKCSKDDLILFRLASIRVQDAKIILVGPGVGAKGLGYNTMSFGSKGRAM